VNYFIVNKKMYQSQRDDNLVAQKDKCKWNCGAVAQIWYIQGIAPLELNCLLVCLLPRFLSSGACINYANI